MNDVTAMLSSSAAGAMHEDALWTASKLNTTDVSYNTFRFDSALSGAAGEYCCLMKFALSFFSCDVILARNTSAGILV
jgi:hypothetical protein